MLTDPFKKEKQIKTIDELIRDAFPPQINTSQFPIEEYNKDKKLDNPLVIRKEEERSVNK